ncbi:MAG: IS3 family transposase [Saprospiraceae bacterium]
MFGKTKQAYYKKEKSVYKQAIEERVIVEAVRKERISMPKIGTRKLLVKLLDQGIDVGRDKLFAILDRNNLLIRGKRTRVVTTHSNHWFRKYPNLIKGLEVRAPNKLWVSDITYVETKEGFVYLFLVTDAYSRKIVGFKVAEGLTAKHAVEALQMALKGLTRTTATGLIHHSDRGVQYCCNEYVKLLTKWKIDISMAQNGDPLENAIAERVNGILKVEWLYDGNFESLSEAKDFITRAIQIYNNQRPHSSIEMLTPSQAHCKNGELKRTWKNYYKKRMDHETLVST